MPIHSFEVIPYDTTGAEIDCWLAQAPAAVRLGCGCGWRGAAVPLAQPALAACYGDPSDDSTFDLWYETWQAEHAAELVPALADVRHDPVADAVYARSPTG